MFDIYIKNYKQGNSVMSTETRMLHIPFTNPDEVYINSPMVKQDTNAAGSFDFEIEPKSPFYNSFLHMRTILRVVYDGYTIFRGRVLAINNTFRGNRKIRCEDALGFLNDTQYPGIEDKNRPNETVGAYLTKLINNHNTTCGQSDKQFTLGQVPGSYTSAITADQRVENRTEKHGKTSWDSTRSGLDDLISSYGGYIRTRYEEDNKTYIDWIKNYFVVNNQEITLGTNLIDQTNSLEIDNVFTAVIPFGASETKNESTIVTDIAGYNTNLHSGSNYVTVSDLYNKIYTTDSARNQYLNKGYHTPADYRDAVTNYGLIFKTVSFPNADSKAVLWNYTLDWMINNYMGVINDFNIKVVDKHQIGEDGNNIQKYLVGDKVTIKYPTFNDAGNRIMASKTLTIKTITYDLFNPENTQITVGIPSDLLDHEYGVKKTKTNKTTNKKNTDDTPSPPKPNRKSPPPTAKIHIHAAIRSVLTSLHIDFTLGTYKVFSSAWSDMGNVPSYSYVISQFKYNGSTYYIGFNSGGIYYRRGDTTSSPIAYIIPSSSGKIGFSSTTGGVKYYSLNTSAGRNEFIGDEIVNDWVVVTTSDSDTEGAGSSITASSSGTKISSPGISVKNLPLYPRQDKFTGVPPDEKIYLTEPPDGYLGPTYDNVPPGQLPPPSENPDDPLPTPKTTFCGLFGYDNNGDWMVKVNEPITYTDDAGSHKVEGAIVVKDLQLPDVPSFKAELAYIGTLFADQAYVNNLYANHFETNDADINTLFSGRITTQNLAASISDIDNLHIKYVMTIDNNASLMVTPGGKIQVNTGNLDIILSKGSSDGHPVTARCDVANLIKGARVVSAGNNSFKLEYQDAYTNEWRESADSVTFSRAVSLSGNWSGTTYTVSANNGIITGTAPSTTVISAVEVGGLSVSANANVNVKIYHTSEDNANQLSLKKLLLVENVSSKKVILRTNDDDEPSHITKGEISTASTYNAGWDYGLTTCVTTSTTDVPSTEITIKSINYDERLKVIHTFKNSKGENKQYKYIVGVNSLGDLKITLNPSSNIANNKIQTSITVSVSDNGRSDSKTLTLERSVYQQDSTHQNECVVLKNGSTIIGRIDSGFSKQTVSQKNLFNEGSASTYYVVSKSAYDNGAHYTRTSTRLVHDGTKKYYVAPTGGATYFERDWYYVDKSGDYYLSGSSYSITQTTITKQGSSTTVYAVPSNTTLYKKSDNY